MATNSQVLYLFTTLTMHYIVSIYFFHALYIFLLPTTAKIIFFMNWIFFVIVQKLFYVFNRQHYIISAQ